MGAGPGSGLGLPLLCGRFYVGRFYVGRFCVACVRAMPGQQRVRRAPLFSLVIDVPAN